MNSKKELMRKMAALESINDQLMTELAYVDQLMRQIGFSNGLASVKDTAQEIIEESPSQETKYQKPLEEFGF
jgi:hypothetical protein